MRKPFPFAGLIYNFTCSDIVLIIISDVFEESIWKIIFLFAGVMNNATCRNIKAIDRHVVLNEIGIQIVILGQKG